MATLPPVLDEHDLPVAELAAMRLDGDLYSLGEGYSPIDEFETPAHRARSVLGRRSSRLIAELGTAAWIWGAAPRPPTPLEFCADLSSRARLRPSPLAAVRELVLDADDTVRLDGFAVTTPLRTAVDLARFRDPDPAVTAGLASIGGFGRTECIALLGRRRNLPGKRRAQRLLEEVLE